MQLKDAAPASSDGREEMNGESPELYKARDLAAAESSLASGFALNRANEDIGHGRRTQRHYLPLKQRIQLYDEVQRLRKEGLSYRQIVETVHGVYGVWLARSQIYYWVYGRHTPLGHANKFEATPSATLAYVIGVKASDGCVYNYGYDYRFELGTIDYEFAAETGCRLATLLGREKPLLPRWDNNNSHWRVSACSILLHDFLRQPLDRLKPYIEHCRDCVAAFLRAFLDGEAGIYKRMLTVYNTDRGMLCYIQQLLQRHFGIKTTGPRMYVKAGRCFRDPRNGKTYKTNKACYRLYIRARSLPLVHKYIGFTIIRKQRRLIEAIQ